jgi:hypothetical protein
VCCAALEILSFSEASVSSKVGIHPSQLLEVSLEILLFMTSAEPTLEALNFSEFKPLQLFNGRELSHQTNMRVSLSQWFEWLNFRPRKCVLGTKCLSG